MGDDPTIATEELKARLSSLGGASFEDKVEAIFEERVIIAAKKVRPDSLDSVGTVGLGSRPDIKDSLQKVGRSNLLDCHKVVLMATRLSPSSSVALL